MKNDPTLEVLEGEIARRKTEIEALEKVLGMLRGEGEPMNAKQLLLPAPEEKKRRKSKTAPKHKPKTIREPPRDARKESDCPLDWEIGGKTFTLELREALIMWELSDGEVVPMAQLMKTLSVSKQTVFAALKVLRDVLEDQVTGHTVEARRGAGYVLVECGGDEA